MSRTKIHPHLHPPKETATIKSQNIKVNMFIIIWNMNRNSTKKKGTKQIIVILIKQTEFHNLKHPKSKEKN